MRRISSRAVPDGRSALARRCHSTMAGSNPPIAAAERGCLLDEAEEDRGAGGKVRCDDRGRAGGSEGPVDRAPGSRPSRSSR